MSNFWDEKYKSIGVMWQFEPSDSAIIARDLFVRNGLKKVLIPGVGYGRNAKIFAESGLEVTGIEISETAIQMARENGLEFPVFQGSVTEMPFDSEVYDGIFCYALIHLLNQNDRRQFIKSCYNQLQPGGIMVFSMVSKNYQKLFNKGKLVSKDRYWMEKGLTVFFYDEDSVQKEFEAFGLVECREIDEPVKHMENEEPMKFWLVVCRKTSTII